MGRSYASYPIMRMNSLNWGKPFSFLIVYKFVNDVNESEASFAYGTFDVMCFEKMKKFMAICAIIIQF